MNDSLNRISRRYILGIVLILCNANDERDRGDGKTGQFLRYVIGEWSLNVPSILPSCFVTLVLIIFLFSSFKLKTIKSFKKMLINRLLPHILYEKIIHTSFIFIQIEEQTENQLNQSILLFCVKNLLFMDLNKQDASFLFVIL